MAQMPKATDLFGDVTPREAAELQDSYLGELNKGERRGWGRLALHLDGKAAGSLVRYYIYFVNKRGDDISDVRVSTRSHYDCITRFVRHTVQVGQRVVGVQHGNG